MRSEYVDCCTAGGTYHCIPARDGTLYVACERDATLEPYDPLEVMPEIILLLLQIGIAYDGEGEIGGRVTEFCRRYGQAAMLTRGRRTEYCSVSCRNVMDVANSRRRKRDKPQPD